MTPEWMLAIFFNLQETFSKSVATRTVFPVKIGLASVKPSQRLGCNTHFTSLIMRPSSSEPSFTSDVFPSSPSFLSS